jgi:hypothetical protein
MKAGIEGRDMINSATYRRRDLGQDAKYEPNNALANGNRLMSGEGYCQRKLPSTYLLPEEAL